MIIALPLAVMLIGLLIYLIAKDGKVSEVGRIMFMVGLFFVVYEGAPLVIHSARG